MRFIRLETRGRETADKRTRDAPVQGASLLLWTFVRGSGRRTASLPVWRLGYFRRRRFVCGPIYRGKDRGARASRRPQPWGIRCRTRRQDAAPGVEESRGQTPGPLWRHFPGESARGVGPLRAGVSGPFSPPPVAARGTDSAAGRDTSFPPQGSLVQASKTRLSNQKSRACGSRQLPAGRPALRQRCSRYCPRSQPCSTGTCGRKTPWRMPRRSSRP